LAYLTAGMRVATWCQGAAKNHGTLTYPLTVYNPFNEGIGGC